MGPFASSLFIKHITGHKTFLFQTATPPYLGSLKGWGELQIITALWSWFLTVHSLLMLLPKKGKEEERKKTSGKKDSLFKEGKEKETRSEDTVWPRVEQSSVKPGDSDISTRPAVPCIFTLRSTKCSRNVTALANSYLPLNESTLAHPLGLKITHVT